MSKCIHGFEGQCPACAASYASIVEAGCEHEWKNVSVFEVPERIREACIKCSAQRVGVPLSSLNQIGPDNKRVQNDFHQRELIDALIKCVDEVGKNTALLAYGSWIAPGERMLREEFTKILNVTGLIWSADKPTKPGFYWFRENNELFRDELYMVEVRGDGTMWRSHYIEEEIMTEGQWAGPLEPPV